MENEFKVQINDLSNFKGLFSELNKLKKEEVIFKFNNEGITEEQTGIFFKNDMFVEYYIPYEFSLNIPLYEIRSIFRSCKKKKHIIRLNKDNNFLRIIKLGDFESRFNLSVVELKSKITEEVITEQKFKPINKPKKEILIINEGSTKIKPNLAYIQLRLKWIKEMGLELNKLYQKHRIPELESYKNELRSYIDEINIKMRCME